MVRMVVACCLFAVSLCAGAASWMDRLDPETAYYYDSFDSTSRPWAPGQHLNIEEVFKNYQYYEIVLDRDSKGMTVSHYVRGSKEGSERYLFLPDGSLQKAAP